MARKDAGYALKSPRGRPHDLIAHAFDFVEDGIHVVVAVLLVVAGGFVLWSVLTTMVKDLQGAADPLAIVTFLLGVILTMTLALVLWRRFYGSRAGAEE